MKKKEAMKFVADIAATLPEFDRSDDSLGWCTKIWLRGIAQAITVQAKYNTSTWGSDQSSKTDRVTIDIGRQLSEGRYVTRTFRVRDDDTLNGDGIRKALHELLEIIKRSRVMQADIDKQNDTNAAARERARQVLEDAGLLTDDAEVRVAIATDGTIRLTATDLTPERARDILRMVRG